MHLGRPFFLQYMAKGNTWRYLDLSLKKNVSKTLLNTLLVIGLFIILKANFSSCVQININECV
jgi:hypothetical protein